MRHSLNSTVVIDAPRGQVRIAQSLPVAFILGPCAIESRAHALETAAAIREIADRLKVGAIYKSSFDKANRTSATSYRGPGLAGALDIFAELRATSGLPVLTDVHLPGQCAPVAEAVDVLQIPAFLCRQTDLLEAAAKTRKPVNVKKGQFLAPWDMRNVAGKLLAAGARDVLLTERGSSFGYNALVTDFRGLPIMAASGAPVVFDATHSVQQPGGLGASSGGQREFVPLLARAAAAVGVAAIFMETHENPDKAPSDGPNMVPLSKLEGLMRQIVEIDALAKAQEKLDIR